MEQVLTGGPRNLAIYGKWASTLDFSGQERVLLKGFQYLNSSYVQVLWFHVCVYCVEPAGQSSRLCTCFGCMTCDLGLLSLKSNSVSH